MFDFLYTLLLNQLKLLATSIIFFTLLQNILSFLVTHLFVRSTKFTFSFGFLFLNSLHFLEFKTPRATLSIRRAVVRLGWNLNLEFTGIDIVIPKNHQDTKRSQSDSITEIKLSVPLKKTTFSFLCQILPLNISFHNANIYIEGVNKRAYADVGSLCLRPLNNNAELELTVFFHDAAILQTENSLHHFEYSLHLHISEKDNETAHNIRFVNWKSSLKFGELKLKVPDSEDKSTHRPFTEQRAIRQILFPYRAILMNLNVLDIKVENLRLNSNYMVQLFVSNVVLYIKSVRSVRHGLLDTLTPKKSSLVHDEINFTANTLVIRVAGEQILRIPVFNAIVDTDLLSFLFDSVDITHLQLACTLSIINPSILIPMEKAMEFLENYHKLPFSQEKSSDRRFGWRITKSMCPKFVFKTIISNLTCTLVISPSKHLVLRVNNTSVSMENKQISKSQQVMIFATQPSHAAKLIDKNKNYLKLNHFSLFLFKNPSSEKELAQSFPIVLFDKWESYNDDIIESPHIVNGTLRELDIQLNRLEVFECIHELLAKSKICYTKFVKPGSREHANSSKFSNYDVKLRLKNASTSIMASHYLPEHLDTLEENGVNLTSCLRGLNMLFQESFVFLNPSGKTLKVISGTLNRVTGDFNNKVEEDSIANISNLKIEASKNALSFSLPQLRLNFDVNVLWTLCFVKNILKSCLGSDPNGKTKEVSSFRGKSILSKLTVNIGSILIDARFPQDLQLLFSFKSLNIEGSSYSFRFHKFSTFVSSVYYKSSPVFVPLLTIKDFSLALDDLIDKGEFIATTSLIKINTEYHLRFYRIVDGLVTTFKACKQIKIAFKDVSNFRRLEPVPELPKELSKINIKAKKLLIIVEEDPFEQELGLIYKVGVLEQRERLEKLAQFKEQSKAYIPNYGNSRYKTTGISMNMTSTLANNEEQYLEEREKKLFENFSTSWISRFRKAKLTFHGKASPIFNCTEFGSNYKLFNGSDNSSVLKVSAEDLELDLNQPSFGLSNCAEFLYKHGKHIPENTVYSTLIPMNMNVRSQRLLFVLRDYSLPVLSFPDTHITGDVVFAENMATETSRRTIYVPFVPSANTKARSSTNSIYGDNIIRTLNPIKTFMNLKCVMESPLPTTITWGKSFQPGYQSVMLWFDYLTKPPLDPSEKLGFWDKFRLLIHGTLAFEWSKASEVHLNIKGSHDPYKIIDDGAGLTFCWGGGTKLVIHGSADPTEFLKIDSSKFLLAVRDFTNTDKFDKVLMRLDGEVIWKLGLLFEGGNLKKAGQEWRQTKFKPHYEINLFNPKFVSNLTEHDSYRGFRSSFIHMSFGIFSDNKAIATNSVHLAPHSMSHFLKWWKLFNTYTSGPIRQGSLFPELIQNGKKFGKSLFTVKYQLALAPLTITHAYRHADSQLDLKENNNVAFTGLKGRIESLKIDLHQKRVKIIRTDEKLNVSRPVWAFRMNTAEIDCIDADIRILSTIFDQEAIEELLAKNLGIYNSNDSNGYSRTFSPIEADMLQHSNWYDFEDYIDLNQIMLISKIPLKFKTIPFLYSPRISYFRNINDEGCALEYPFGDENAHVCSIGESHPERTQESLARKRAKEIEEQIKTISLSMESLSSMPNSNILGNKYNERIQKLNEELHNFKHRLHIIHKVLEDLELSKEPNVSFAADDIESAPSNISTTASQIHLDVSRVSLKRETTIESFRSMRRGSSANVKSSFDNRFMIHNVLLKINKDTRDNLLNYASNVFERRKTQYFLTHKAVTLLDELLKNTLKKKIISNTELDAMIEEDLVSNSEFMQRFEELIREVPSKGFKAFDNYLIKLISPQIQITSNVESNKAILITSRDIEMGIIDVNQVETSYGDTMPLDMESLMETRYCTTLTDAHFFVFDKEIISGRNALGFTINGYGMDEGSEFWPPWMPMEMCYDSAPLGEYVFLKRNAMFLTFTRPNPLFFNDKTHFLEQSDSKFRIGFPELFIMSDSEQYSAIYNIIEDLVSFISNVDKKVEKLSKVFLADEVKNSLDKLDASVVVNLQNKVRELYHTRGVLKLHDPQTYKRLALDIAIEIQATLFELGLLMTAIKRNYDTIKVSKKDKPGHNRLNWQIGADELIWELYDEKKMPFLTFGLGPSNFIRSQSSDGANSNKVSISTLQCFNLQADPVYREILSPYQEYSKFKEGRPLVEILWVMGTPVGGIADLEDVTVALQPLKFKMDHKTSDKLMKYLFPDSSGVSSNAEDDGYHADATSTFSSASSHTMRRKGSDTSFSSSLSMASFARVKGINNWDLNSISNSSRAQSMKAPSTSKRPTLKTTTTNDMNEMVTRSSTYFNVGSVVIKKVTMSISYRGSRSLITNVDNLLVKVPSIRYTNKLWSRDELITTLKRDIIRIVLQHTGNIIGNKFIPHKKETKYEPLKQFSNLLKSEPPKSTSTSTSQISIPKERMTSPTAASHSNSANPDIKDGGVLSDDYDELEAFYPYSSNESQRSGGGSLN